VSFVPFERPTPPRPQGKLRWKPPPAAISARVYEIANVLPFEQLMFVSTFAQSSMSVSPNSCSVIAAKSYFG
jgi:hypothetical protein